MLQEFELRLRTKLQPDSLEAILLKYLNSRNTIYSLKDMVITPLLSYWLPLAYQPNDTDNQKKLIRNCIYRLKLHQQFLQEMLGEDVNKLDNTNELKEQITDDLKNQELSLVTQNHDLLESPTQKEEWFNPFK